MGANQDQIEAFIANLANSPEPEKLIEVANQVARVSRSESIPLEELEGHVKQKEEGNKMLDEEIKEKRAILERTDVDIKTIDEYKQLKLELNKHGLSIEDPDKLLAVLKNIEQLKYDPNKIIAEFLRLNSLRRSERTLKRNCQRFENRMSEYRQALLLLQQIRALGIDIDKLIPFSIAVDEKAQTNRLSKSAAAYHVIDEIENYNRIGGLKYEISRLAAQRYAMNEICAQRNRAIISLLNLQNYGITDDEILDVCEFLNRVHIESAATIRR